MDAALAAGVGFIVAFVAVALYLLVFNTVRRRVWLRAYDLPTTGRRAAVADAPLPAPGPPVRLSSVSADGSVASSCSWKQGTPALPIAVEVEPRSSAKREPPVLEEPDEEPEEPPSPGTSIGSSLVPSPTTLRADHWSPPEPPPGPPSPELPWPAMPELPPAACDSPPPAPRHCSRGRIESVLNAPADGAAAVEPGGQSCSNGEAPAEAGASSDAPGDDVRRRGGGAAHGRAGALRRHVRQRVAPKHADPSPGPRRCDGADERAATPETVSADGASRACSP